MGGEGRSGGRYVPDALMDCWTSCSAISIFRLRLNCKVITERPLELVDVICCRPGTWPN